MKRITVAFKRCLISALCLSVLLLIGFEASSVNASLITQDPRLKLPDFLVRVAEYMSRGNSTYLALILNEMVQQETLKQEIIKSTKGAVLNPPIIQDSSTNLQPDYVGYYRISSINQISEPMKDVNGELIGQISNPQNLVGADGRYAEFMTRGWNKNYAHPEGGEACANGPLTGTCQSGQVYVQGWRGALTYPPNGFDEDGEYEWRNYIFVWVSYGYTSNPHYVGYVQVLASSNTAYYVGPAGSYGVFNYIYLSSWTPPWYPQDYSPHIYNDVYLDTAFVWGSNP